MARLLERPVLVVATFSVSDKLWGAFLSPADWPFCSVLMRKIDDGSSDQLLNKRS